MIWFTGSALGLCLLMIGGLLAVVLTNGLGFFWPSSIVRLTLKDGRVIQGEIAGREAIPDPGQRNHLKHHRLQLKVGNRDLLGYDFKWVDEDQVATREQPKDVYLVERREYGALIGTPKALLKGDRTLASGAEAVGRSLPELLAKARRDRAAIRHLEKDKLGEVNYRLERLRLRARNLDLAAGQDPARDQSAARAALQRETAESQAAYQRQQQALDLVVAEAAATSLVWTATGGQEREVRLLDLYRAYPANDLSLVGRVGIYLSRLWGFVSDDPRESNTEGGVWPAIFGTVMMVMIMSLVVVPLGLLAALYLREYARQGPLVRLVRIAVNNLAGVPSIVFGVFGLGFFVYFVGGTIDQIFYAESLPTPTYGTGGILWASLTLALLTVPVVIVSSEEALSAVPRSVREASLAMGATKFQTILRVVLPAAAPGILTGLILAMARGAGEVAPLMLTGVVKLAPELPLDGHFPFFHLDRKFMHLGFHIYDVGFQSPNVEAAKPMVYGTAILLLLIVVLLNLTAILVRNRLRKKYQSSAF